MAAVHCALRGGTACWYQCTFVRWVTAEVRDADPALYPQWYKKWRRLTQDGDLQPERFHRWMHRAYGNAFTLRVAPQMVRLIGSAEVRRRLLFAARAASERSAKTRWRGAIGKVRAYARFLIAGRSDKGRRPMHILPDGTREPLTHRIPTDPAVLTRLIPNVGTIEGKNRDERKNGVLAMDKVQSPTGTLPHVTFWLAVFGAVINYRTVQHTMGRFLAVLRRKVNSQAR